MVQSHSLLNLAKQGDPKAIAALMNRSLHPKKIAVKVGLKQDCLFVFASADRPPEMPFVTHFVRQGLQKLDPPNINRVVVQGHTEGSTVPAWQDVIYLRNFVPPPPPSIETNEPEATRSPSISAEEIPRSRSRKKRTRPTVIDRFKQVLGAFFYIVLLALFAAIAVSLKIFTTLLAENSLYQIEFIGDLMRGIEIVEVFNVLVFAILGAGFGIATALVPKKIGVRLSAALLVIISPIVFSISGWIRYDNWVDRLASNDNISPARAREISNLFLYEKVERQGYLGFYLYTAQYPVLPDASADIERLDELDDRVVSRITNIFGFTSERLYFIFSLCIWGVRGFYFLLSGVTAAAHFIQGTTIADKLARRQPDPDTETT